MQCRVLLSALETPTRRLANTVLSNHNDPFEALAQSGLLLSSSEAVFGNYLRMLPGKPCLDEGAAEPERMVFQHLGKQGTVRTPSTQVPLGPMQGSSLGTRGNT